MEIPWHKCTEPTSRNIEDYVLERRTTGYDAEAVVAKCSRGHEVAVPEYLIVRNPELRDAVAALRYTYASLNRRSRA